MRVFFLQRQQPPGHADAIFVLVQPGQNIKLLITLVLLIGLTPYGCRNDSEEKAARSILKPEQGGDFRGIKIGDNPDLVKSKESARSVYTMPDELVYRIDPGELDSTWYEISYNFNNQGLYDISMEVFPVDNSQLERLKREFIDHYVEKYGACVYRNGYCQWRAMTEKGHIVSITITDTLAYQTRPSLMINFNETQQ